MLKKTLLAVCLPAAFYLQAQDISELRNVVDVYSSNPITGSAKYTSMAGSMGALGGDISTTSVNPAGIGVNIASDVSVSLRTGSIKNTSTMAGLSATGKVNKTDLGNASAIIAFDLSNTNSPWKFVNIGVNYNSTTLNDFVVSPGNNSIIVQKNLIDNNNNPLVGNLAYQGHAYSRDGYYDKTNFTVGANYNNNLYFGVGINMSNISISQEDFASFKLDANNVSDIYQKQYTPYLEQTRGFSANFGVIGKVNNQFRLGAALETPTWWSSDRVYRDYQIDNNGLTNSVDYSEVRDLRTPFKATFSAAYVPNKNFALNVDYIQNLGKPEYTTKSAVNHEINSFYNDYYRSASEIRAGAEYRIQALRLRGGYAYSSNPFNTVGLTSYTDNGQMQNANYSNLLASERNTLGLGIGYDFRAFYLDVAYQNISSKYDNAFLYGSENQGTGYYSNNFDINAPAYATSKVKNQINNFVFTLGWKF